MPWHVVREIPYGEILGLSQEGLPKEADLLVLRQSGGNFKVLVYMHRMDKFTVQKIRLSRNEVSFMAGRRYLCIMFYRRKIILALLQLLHGRLDKLRLQKLVFLTAQGQSRPVFEFVPYKYGCFSFSLNADLSAMVRNGQLAEDADHYRKVDGLDYLAQIKAEDRKSLSIIATVYGKSSSNELMRFTYLKFPFYAINSVKAPELLTEDEYQKVRSVRPRSEDTILFTIGYEGISFERYLTTLLQHDVKVLVDVRNNPVSMKFGFSKAQLKKACENLGLAYVHIPEVGIVSDKRQQLNSQRDYDNLFESYKTQNLIQTEASQDEILSLLHQYKRIALTCFEANICQCHRKPLAEAITKRSGYHYQLKHI